MELALDHCCYCAWYINSWFQSLFSWNLLSIPSLPPRWRHPGRVSILVFVELALDHRQVIRSRLRRRVSILVFVELALDLHSTFTIQISLSPFQSLFSWNLLSINTPALLASSSDGVSILVFVELALDPFSAVWVSGENPGFNPCFRGTCSRSV